MNTFRTPSSHFYGWYVTAVCLVIAMFAWGFGFYGLGIYVRSMQIRNGWSPGVVSSCIAVYFFLGAIISTYVGEAIDRRGSRFVLALGTVALGAGIAGLAFVTQRWQLVAPFLLMSVGWGCLTVTALSTTLVRWFKRRLGLASGVAFSGASLAGIVVAPLLVLATEAYGFTTAVLTSGVVMLLVLLPIVLAFIKNDPADIGQHPDGDPPSQATVADPSCALGGPTWTRAALLKTATFWSIAGPFSLVSIAQVGFLVHQLSMLTVRVSAEQAAAMVSATSLAGFLGRIGVSALADKQNPRVLSIAVFVVQTAGFVGVALSQSQHLLYVWCILFGLGIGNVITLPSLIVRHEFGVASFGIVSGAVNGVTHSALGLGPLIVGMAHAHSGSYTAGLFVLAAMNGVASLGMLASLRSAPVSDTVSLPSPFADRAPAMPWTTWVGWSLGALILVAGAAIARMSVAGSVENRREEPRVSAQALHSPAAGATQEQTAPPERGWVSGSGVVELAERETHVAASSPGRVARVLVREDDRVVAGQPLVELECAIERELVHAAQADVESADSELDRARRGLRKEDMDTLASAVGLLEAKVALSRVAVERARRGIRSGEGTADELERAQRQAEDDLKAFEDAAAKRKVAAAGSRREDIQGARALFNAAKAKLAHAEAQLERMTVRAPLAGHILEARARAGEYYTPGSSEPLVTIGNPEELRARVAIDERDTSGITVGSDAYLTAIGQPQRKFMGKVVGFQKSSARQEASHHNPDQRQVLIGIDEERELVVGVRVTGYVNRGIRPHELPKESSAK